MRSRTLLLGLLIWLATTSAWAHEVRPAYLAVTEMADGLFEVTWKAPTVAGGVLAVQPAFSAECAAEGDIEVDDLSDAALSRWRLQCPQGLGESLGVDGLEQTLTSAFIRVEWRNGRTVEGLVTAAHPLLALTDQAPPAVIRYLSLGVEHILGGIDHLSFVACLVLVIGNLRLLLLTLTSFTLAHSLTLAASALDIVRLPQRPVEAVIALSIALVAREAVLGANNRAGFASRSPWVLAFGFGLLHGFGFAGALAEIGLPDAAQLQALLMFNVGVELGQIGLVIALFPLLLLIRSRTPQYAPKLVGGVGAMLGIVSMFWLTERLFL